VIVSFSAWVSRDRRAWITVASTICNLPAHRQPALGPQQRVEPSKQPLRRAGTRQLLAIQPDRLGVRDGIVQGQPDKPHKRQPVLELGLGLVVRQRVERLQYQRLNISTAS
jgi:hypothetical protein